MTDRRGAGGGLRGDLKQRVKTGRGRTASQKRWLERQLNDPYVARAKREGYRSRAAFKLLEIDERFKILKPNQKIIDLGAAPGGWSQVAAKIVGPSGRIVGIDLLEIEPMVGVEFITLDFLDPDAPKRLIDLLGGQADIVMSDMAANTTGHKQTDHLRIIGLAETAAEFAREVLAPGGTYLAKVFQGGTEGTLLADLKRDFTLVRHVKPSASRADSSELYVLATGFRGAVAETAEGDV
ncbi:RlmE family RNA methyltransferase [Methylobacterium sp. SD274]|uniref:RlmE family RNA methyltransferase n=1 Tax=Methylobacterium sp. SD274 TaxID=2782009 RepID=UPI001A97C0DD|nr:RlmE family RNA methyltransferase [Methylobacterium sp. SD274]MBO1020002.1 RlmE family RNA methyltransferase [Methylobacterium sp. SD274]